MINKLLFILGPVRALGHELYSTATVVIKFTLRNIFTGHGVLALKLLYRSAQGAMQNFRANFISSVSISHDLSSDNLQRLHRDIYGLHSLLAGNKDYSYSILIPVYKPDPVFFKTALMAALQQTAPSLEILIGYDGPQPQEIYDVVTAILNKDSRASSIIKVIHCDREKTGGGISRTTNRLAEEASGKFLLLMDHDDWIRPDLLYRYELALRLARTPENTVLFCDEYKINERDEVIPSSFFSKPERPIFPYLFVNFICHCLLVPKSLFVTAGKLRPECDGAQDYDLCLRLDLVGAQFQNVPIFLYAWRVHAKSTAKNLSAKGYASNAGVRALTDYVAARGLNWGNIREGYFPTSYAAEPEIRKNVEVQVIILFKDQRELTLKAVESIKRQALEKTPENMRVRITCVDNSSTDTSIADELKTLGAEVLRVTEPFNFSRLNNFAAQHSIYKNSELILFMNNDVELDPNALKEMARWIDQPDIGMVGCRLHYPDKKLQHVGVELYNGGPMKTMNFIHRDSGARFNRSMQAQVLGITDAVTAACALVRRELFQKVGGFDEIWYPVAYSDMELARKFRRQGYYCFFTPFAFGVHHESKSRGFNCFEEMEKSRWLFMQVEKRERGHTSPPITHSGFDFP